jgi:hypothetical protein
VQWHNVLVDVREILLGAFVSANELQSAAKYLNTSADEEIIDLIGLGVELVLGFVKLAAIQKFAANQSTVAHILVSGFKNRHRLIQRVVAHHEAAVRAFWVVTNPSGIKANGFAVKVDVTASVLQGRLRGHALRISQRILK